MRIILRSLCIVCICLLGGAFSAYGAKSLHIVASTFPVYQFTRVITEGRADVSVSLLFPAQAGCPHDYALTPQDMQKLSSADILVINGLGLEVFLDAAIAQVNPKVERIDSSRNVADTLRYRDAEHAEYDAPAQQYATNPHIFASPHRAATMVQTIADGLSRIDTQGAALYKKNSAAYVATLLQLGETMQHRAAQLANHTIITQHDSFSYLAKDLHLDVVALLQEHAGQEPSAARMLELIAHAKNAKVGAVFTEPQYAQQAARAIAQEAGIPVGILDPVATGPDNAPLDYYETQMHLNSAVLEQYLGIRNKQ